MLTSVFNASKRISGLQSVCYIRSYCQKSNGDELNAQKTGVNNESKLLTVLNNIDNSELYKHVLNEKSYNVLEKWKAENGGSIASFDDLENIKGISKKTAEKIRNFCYSQVAAERSVEEAIFLEPQFEQPIEINYDEFYPKSTSTNGNFILYDESIPPIDVPSRIPDWYSYSSKKEKNNKSFKFSLTPKLPKNTKVDSFTAIHQDVAFITCTRFSTTDNWKNDIKVDAWLYHEVPKANDRNPCVIYNDLLKIVDNIPDSDIYILDDHIKALRFHKPVLAKRVTDVIHKNQQMVTLVALLQARRKQECNVFFTPYSSAARQYDLLIKQEAISSQEVIKNILRNNDSNQNDSLNFQITNELKSEYHKSSPMEREFLGKTMLLGLTFIQLRLQ